ncbi:UPF0187-domain-containing protein [Flagelloscypha sp. PMI_526]|nr:UPF0187-domain-containing protein [Flagelloscypha sp. PMI_526]
MVAQNPLFAGKWTLKKFNATVINDVWPEVLFFSLIATMVWSVSTYTSHDLSIPSGLLTVLGTVLGLVISFRTSSAYERFQDGRKLWTAIQVVSRNLALQASLHDSIWLHVPFEREDKGAQKKQTVLQSVIEKRSYVNLIQAFSVSVKHYLRGEPGPYYQDLYPLISFLPRYANESPDDTLPLWAAFADLPVDPNAPRTASPSHAANAPPPENGTDEEKPKGSFFSSTSRKSQSRLHRKRSFDPEAALPSVESERPLLPARNPPATSLADYIPLFRLFAFLWHKIRRQAVRKDRTALGGKKKLALIDSNVPLEIVLYLSSYTAFLMKCGLLQPAMATGMANNITSLQDTLTNLERVRTTPLPFAYQAHLRMSLWLYLFFLPFQIQSTFHYLTIPATAFASFLLLGFLEIGQEIEDFGYDANDLDMDGFCLSIQRELHEITAHTSPDPSTYLFTESNQPFAPSDRTTAANLTREEHHEYLWRFHRDEEKDKEGYAVAPGLSSIRRALLYSWRDVDRMTRE